QPAPAVFNNPRRSIAIDVRSPLRIQRCSSSLWLCLCLYLCLCLCLCLCSKRFGRLEGVATARTLSIFDNSYVKCGCHAPQARSSITKCFCKICKNDLPK